MKNKKILVVGASGYVGSRLVPRLLNLGYNVKAAGRSVERLSRRPWARQTGVELCAVNVQDLESLATACGGCQAVYYLMHSMEAGQKNFEASDRKAARNMALAAEKSGVEQIIYLGGLGDDDTHLSAHLRSRREVGEILSQGRVAVTTLRAAMIIGTGSASFEIMRHLVNNLPVMITPRWLFTKSQPIAIRNVLEYLTSALVVKETRGQVLDIGGPDILNYKDLMTIYAQSAGLPARIYIPVPVLTPQLSSLWIRLVTPVPMALARPLAHGLRNTVVCRECRILQWIPQRLIPCREAIELALGSKPLADDTVPPAEWKYPADPSWVGRS